MYFLLPVAAKEAVYYHGWLVCLSAGLVKKLLMNLSI